MHKSGNILSEGKPLCLCLETISVSGCDQLCLHLC